MDNNYNYRQPWIMQRADPYVYHKDGFYYFTGSLPKYDGIALRRSERLKGLADAEETVVWKKHESGLMSEHIWAPELHYLDGNGIFILPEERKKISGRSDLMYWNVKARIRSRIPGLKEE